MSINKKIGATFIGLLIATVMAACSSVTESIDAEISMSESPLYGKFIWHDLVTTDINAAREFYSELFGWSYVDTDRPDGTGPYTLIKSGNAYVGGMVSLDNVDKDVNQSRWIGYMSVEDVDRAVADTESAGGTAVVSARDVGTIGRAAVVRDPQGAVLGIARVRLGDPDDTNSPDLGKIAWNELLATEPVQAAEYYSNLAGFYAKTITRRGGEYIKLVAAGTERAGILKNPIEKLPATWLTYFAVTDPEAASTIVESAGGSVLIPPSNEFREGTVALVKDPTGAFLMLQKWPI